MPLRFLRMRRLLLAPLALVFLLLAGPLAFADATPDDPVVADVVRMLEAGLEPRLILGWLESGNKRPGPLSASDMIALAEADAPAELIDDLLSRAARPLKTEDAPAAVPPGTAEQPRDPPAAMGGVAMAEDCCLVDFSVEYRAPEQDVAGQTDLPRAELYLYLDGRFLARVEPRGDIASRGPEVIKHRVAPGRHRIRLTRELHVPSKNRKAGDARDHRTTVSPSAIEFELQPAAQWTMDIRWSQGVFSREKPLRWRWSRNGVQVAGEKGVGAFQDDWPFLCDDVEISRASGAIADWRATDRSRGCVTWTSLWPHGADSSRADILAEFETAEFRPELGSLD